MPIGNVVIFIVLYMLAVFATGRVLGRRALQREEACVASKHTKCTYVCKSLLCVDGHYLPVLACIVPVLPWLYWLSGYIVDLPKQLAKRQQAKELEHLRHENALKEERARHDLEMEKVAAERAANGLAPQFVLYTNDQR